MKTKAIYVAGVLNPFEKFDFSELTEVRITLKCSFTKLLDDIGEIEAKEDINKVFKKTRTKNYYE
jgi:predicted DNA-binding antitoxin AbrB/MazE fold protein